MQIEVAVPAQAELGEGPCWDVTAQRLLWVDILNARVHRSDPGTGHTETREHGEPVGSVVPRATGGLVLTTPSGVYALDDLAGSAERLCRIEDDQPLTRMNDGKTDPAGRLWTGSMAYDAAPGQGTLYRVGSDRQPVPVVRDVTISNGLAFTPDGRTAYYIDTPQRRVDRLELDDAGDLRSLEPLVDTAQWPGVPDGMTIDVDGCLWIAFCRGAQLRRITPDGRLDRVVELPVSVVTSVVFGGHGHSTLFITTGREGLDGQQLRAEPLAGCVLAADVGTAGYPSVPCVV